MANEPKKEVVLSEGHNLGLVRKVISDFIKKPLFSTALHQRLTASLVAKETGGFIV